MEIKDSIVIAKDFTDTPGARYRSEGDWSGQQFLEDLLLPKFEKAVKERYLLSVELDGVWGYPSSFVSGSFGELSLRFGSPLVLEHIKLVSTSKTKKKKFLDEIIDPQRK